MMRNGKVEERDDLPTILEHIQHPLHVCSTRWPSSLENNFTPSHDDRLRLRRISTPSGSQTISGSVIRSSEVHGSPHIEVESRKKWSSMLRPVFDSLWTSDAVIGRARNRQKRTYTPQASDTSTSNRCWKAVRLRAKGIEWYCIWYYARQERGDLWACRYVWAFNGELNLMESWI